MNALAACAGAAPLARTWLEQHQYLASFFAILVAISMPAATALIRRAWDTRQAEQLSKREAAHVSERISGVIVCLSQDSDPAAPFAARPEIKIGFQNYFAATAALIDTVVSRPTVALRTVEQLLRVKRWAMYAKSLIDMSPLEFAGEANFIAWELRQHLAIDDPDASAELEPQLVRLGLDHITASHRRHT